MLFYNPHLQNNRKKCSSEGNKLDNKTYLQETVNFLKYLCAVTSKKNIVSITNTPWYVRFVTRAAISICVSILITVSGEEKITRILQQHNQFHTSNYIWNGKFHFHVKIIKNSLQFVRRSYKHMAVPSDPPVK